VYLIACLIFCLSVYLYIRGLMEGSLGFMALAAVVSMIMANRYYSGWPFDHACAVKNKSTAVPAAYNGVNVTEGAVHSKGAAYTFGSDHYAYCERGQLNGQLFYDSKAHMTREQLQVIYS
jgi:hypothetical protein